MEALTLTREINAESESIRLIREARGGSLEAFDLLIRKYERRVLKMAYQMVGNADDAQDVAQAVFIRLWKYLGRIRDEARFSTWLYRLVVNCSYDYLGRRRVEREQISLDDPGQSPGELVDRTSIPHDREVMGLELKERILDALAELTPSERTIFVLRDLEGLEVKEIARIHQSSRITVRRHLSNARHKMRRILAELDPALAAKGKEATP